LKFGAQKVGTTSRARILKVTNKGAAAVQFTEMSVTGDFVQTNSCGASVAAHGICSISVAFRPTAIGKLTGDLPLLDNAINSPQVVNLSGKGNRH
jgi:hypothetical protein